MDAPPIQPGESLFLIQGKDGAPHGPFTAQELQAFAASGNLAASDLIRRQDEPQWRQASLESFLDFGSHSIQGSTATPYPWQEKPQPGKVGVLDLVAPVRADPWAVLAGYLGLFSLILVAAPLSLAISILALRSLKQHPERTGRGRAWFGLIMGVLGTPLLFWLILSLLMRP